MTATKNFEALTDDEKELFAVCGYSECPQARAGTPSLKAMMKKVGSSYYHSGCLRRSRSGSIS